MSLIIVFGVSFLAALSGALMPGPLLTVTIAQTAKKGFRASVLLIVGHSVLELIVVIGLWFGLGYFLKIRPVIGAITVLGGLMLLWMGFDMFRSSQRDDIELTNTSEKPVKEAALRHPVLAGMLVSLSNPYWVVWWATIGVTLFAAFAGSALTVIIAFYLGHISGDIIWYLAVGAAVSTGRRVMSGTAYKVIVQVCAVFLVFLGASFLYLMASGHLWSLGEELSRPVDMLRSKITGG